MKEVSPTFDLFCTFSLWGIAASGESGISDE